MAGEHTRFKPGHKTWNKGMAGFRPGGRSSEAWFKAGQKPANTWKPVGSERVTKDGTLERKISDTGIKRIDWRPVHVMEWEKFNGPIPGGHIVVFKDRNNRNFASDNLEVITRAENMRRNTCQRYPKEVVQLIQLRGVLTRKINQRARREKQD